MTLRQKLLLAQAPMALILLALGAVSIGTISVLGDSSQNILKDNYRSVLAAQQMKESLERIDSAAVFRVANRPDRGDPMLAPNRARFDAELRVQEHNLTEPGEDAATRELRGRWERYQKELDAFLSLTDPAARSAHYFERLQPQFVAVKDAAEQILELNQDAMVRKSDRARKLAQRHDELMMAATLLALLVGAFASAWLTSRLLRPLSVLTQAARSIGKGDEQARAVVPGGDEIADLARELNTMAEKVAEYRRSSLGELLQAQQASQAAIDSLPDPVVLLGNDGTISNVNAAAETLLGGAEALSASSSPSAGSGTAATNGAEQSALTTPRELLDRVRAHVAAGKGAYVPKGFEEAARLSTTDGVRFLLPRATPVYGNQGEVVGTSIVLQDVTRLMRFDELKNDLVATVAHEFRTPLTSLRMAIHLCLEELVGPLTPRQADMLHAAREDCERLQGMVDDLLDLSRIQSGQVEVSPAPLSANALLEEAVAQHQGTAGGAGVSLRAAGLDAAPAVLADPERAPLIFANLINNAIRHTPRGSAVEVRALPAGRQVRFEVVDEGPGVPREHQARIFDKFFRVPGTKGEGIGLGLYISRELVRAHGGEMGVESPPGGGARFWFTLPVAA